ncbi:MBL fold metallo-hydrolase [Dyadobacter sp. MSC1_007]|jgi:cAMP phosphodiesterase|uniref:MBL fold metallo-hydrolase n=1 Tax=Dyadobacter sp. MSC1_007 TaxID=2909264 RepID=UPI00202ED966|nr:3',5'-cyclic-nucleotide phosphodiesterase [Dyadobacter sp. MSC1_007]
MRVLISFLLILLLLNTFCRAQVGFKVVPLGVYGGTADGNLSAYMVAPTGTDAYVCLDAGTVSNGIARAIANGAFSVSADIVLKRYIKAYLISHPHLDHVSGMIINSVDDTIKQVYGFEPCIATLRDHYFNWKSWPNLASEGAIPALKKYRYQILLEGEERPVLETRMSVRAFRLAHSNPYESAAFLIRNGEGYVLYLGDTGPDDVEKTDKMRLVWEAVSPLVKSGKLKGIFLEVSYPNTQQDRQLYGHLTPRWLMRELNVLATQAGMDKMRDLNVVVTHIKPTGNNETLIRKELAEGNNLGLKLIFPEQGVQFELR